MRRTVVVAIVALVSAFVLAGCAPEPAAESGNAPTGMDDPSATGEMLVLRWLDGLKGPDTDLAALEEFMAPNFQLVRDDASRANREEYLAEPATVNDYEISDLRALANDADGAATITVDFQLTVDEVINGEHVAATAPRLGTFVWNGSDWTILSWANFGIITDASPAEMPSPTPAS